jgi:hypothetical protein
MGGPQSRSEDAGEERNSQLLLGLEPPIIKPVAQRYTTELSLFSRVSKNMKVKVELLATCCGCLTFEERAPVLTLL